jgi:glycosyltransferase involved in cell wall biosynthesis
MSRIAIVSSGFPPTGGGGVAAAHFNLYGVLRRLGHDVRLYTFLDDPRAPVPPGGGVVRTGRPPRWITDPLHRLFRRFVLRPGDTRTGEAYTALIGALSGWAALRKTRPFAPEILIVSDHGAPSALASRPPGCAVVFVSHHNSARLLEEPLIGRHCVRDARLAVRAEQRAIRGADVVVCPSHYMRDMFRRTYTFQGPVHVIPNVVDLEFVASVPVTDLRHGHGLGRETPIVYIPSAGSRVKGGAYVFEIVRRLAAAHPGEIAFFLSGAIPAQLSRELEFLPKNARVIAPGPLPYEANVGSVKACDLCVSPTLMENFGMALVEAQACGLPVVAFDVGGNRDVVDDGATGHLVPFMDIQALIDRSRDLLADPRGRRRMGDRGRARVETRLAPDGLARAYVDAALAARSPGGGPAA